MTSVTTTQKTPFKAPYEKIYQADTDTQITLAPPPGHSWSRMILPADYSTDKLLEWNAEGGIASGSPWSHFNESAVGSVGYTSINSGTSVVFHQKDNWNNSSTAFSPGDAYDFTVDTMNHTYSYEFYLDNQQQKTSATIINSCDSTSGWSKVVGGGSITVDTFDKQEGTGSIAVLNGTTTDGTLMLQHSIGSLANKEFIEFWMKVDSSDSGNMFVYLVDNAGKYLKFEGSRFAMSSGTWTRWVLPILAPQGTTGSLPSERQSGFDASNMQVIQIGISSGGMTGTPTVIHIDDICSDIGQWVAVEANVPDVVLELDTGIDLYTWNGSAYVLGMNWHPTSVSGTLTSGNMYTLDGTTMTSHYGSSLGAAGHSQAVRNTLNVKNVGDAAGTAFTYSTNYGVKQRIGFKLKVPPSDSKQSNTTGISQIKLKLEVYYDRHVATIATDTTTGYGISTYEFSNDANQYTGLTNLNDSWLVFANPTTKDCDFIITSQRPVGLEPRFDENGAIDRVVLTLSKGTQVFEGSLTHGNLNEAGDWFPSLTLYPSLTMYPKDNEVPAFINNHLLEIISKAYYTS